jgi:hypothetical protein
MFRPAILSLVGVATALVAGDARAADDSRRAQNASATHDARATHDPRAPGDERAVAIVVEGDDADAVGSALAEHLSTPNAVHDARAFRAALAAHGTRSLSSGLGGKAPSTKLVAHARAAASDARVDRVILALSKKSESKKGSSKKGSQASRQLHVWVVDPQAADALVDADVPLDASADASGQADAVWLAITSEFPAPPPKAAPEAKPESSPAGASTSDVATASAEGPSAGADVGPQSTGNGEAATQADGWLLVARADVAAASRHFSYVDRVTSSLRPYDLAATPFASLGLELYPFTRASVPVLRELGLVGGYGRAVGLSSTDTGGARVGTTWQSFDVGLRARALLDPRVLLGASVAYGASDFHFDQPSFGGSLPSADYHFVRAGLDLRVSFGRISVLAGGGYRDVLNAGSLDDLFPRKTVGGVDAFVGGALTVAKHVELSVRLDYSRFFYSFNPQPGDANVAGGALDEMARLSLGLSTTL